ncbi:SDR family oxidoreductase [Halobacillus salinus]|uniref:SDR family oxidoreductase n=1 Tax=Halobacillus salinus TaxID=192814 RepID=UPI0009A873D9|nr:SDR family oxidoreductase [Halobacillus salinus]
MVQNNRVAIVTGASRSKGIGTAICHALAADGIDVFFTHFRSFDSSVEGNGEEPEWPELLAKQLRAYGVRAEQMSLDLSFEDASVNLLDEVEKRLGTASILVHNATYQSETNFRTLDGSVLDHYYQVNNRGPILLSTAFAKRFEKAFPSGGDGRILFLVSGGPDPNNLAYIATKGAVKALTYPLAVGLASLGITVNSVDPGPTDSGWINNDLRDQLLPLFPKGRIGKPEDAAKLIRFLSSSEADWITGQTIHSDGGFLGK